MENNYLKVIKMNKSLNKTTAHIFDEVDRSLSCAVNLANDTRHIGSSRTKGYASIVTFVASVVFGGAGFYGVQALNHRQLDQKVVDETNVNNEMKALLVNSLSNIKLSVDSIRTTKKRVAPSLQIDENIDRIENETKTIKLITGIK